MATPKMTTVSSRRRGGARRGRWTAKPDTFGLVTFQSSACGLELVDDLGCVSVVEQAALLGDDAEEWDVGDEVGVARP